MTLPSENRNDRESVESLRECPVCEGVSWRKLFEHRDMVHGLGGDFTVVSCEGCGLVSYDPLPDAETLRTYYPSDYYAYQGEGSGVELGGKGVGTAVVGWVGVELGRAGVGTAVAGWVTARSSGGLELQDPRAVSFRGSGVRPQTGSSATCGAPRGLTRATMSSMIM